MFSPRVPGRLMAAMLAVAWVAIALMSTDRAAQAGPTDSRTELPLDRGLNQRVSDFTLKNVVLDRPVSLYSFVGKKAIVLVFLGTDCPIGNLYVPRLIELNRAYRNKGVVVLGINSNAHESEQDIAKYVRETGIDFPVLKDHENRISDSILVERTCETVLLDGFGRIRYRGAIDDQYIQGKSKDHP
jgi:peroxiredoxin